MTSPAQDTSRLIDQITDKLYQSISDRKVDIASLPIVITELMQLVECYPLLSGSDKKQVVLNVVTMSIDKCPDLADDTRASLRATAILLGPTIIEGLINASKGLLNLNKETVKNACCCWEIYKIK